MKKVEKLSIKELTELQEIIRRSKHPREKEDANSKMIFWQQYNINLDYKKHLGIKK